MAAETNDKCVFWEVLFELPFAFESNRPMDNFVVYNFL